MSEIVLRRYLHDDFWPTELPSLEEMESVGYDEESRGHLYRLRGGMANINSGEHFGVVVLCAMTWSEEREIMREMRLLFP